MLLLAGASGSGKSRLARLTGCPRLALDDFYLDGDHPELPHTLGIVDWDDIGSWDRAGALTAIVELCRNGTAEVPIYDISRNGRIGTHRLTLGQARMFIAEGVFAPDMVKPCREAGLEVEAIYLDRSRTLTLVLRFVRDVREHRKPVGILLRRGLALWRTEPATRRRALAGGCRPLSMKAALEMIKAQTSPPPAH